MYQGGSFMNLFKRKKRVNELYTIEDLENSRDKIKSVTIRDKKNIKILIIDDEGFDDEVLKSLGYLDIDIKEKYEKLSDYENYDIIFCDINGIARDIDPIYQGAALAKLIKKTYPSKIVIIFSSKDQSLDFYKFSTVVDDIIPKNIKNAEIAEIIDKYIEIINDPIESWKSYRKKISEQGTTPKNIALLEDCYVRGILEQKDTTNDMEKIKSGIKSSTVSFIIDNAIEIVKAYLGQ